MEANPKFRRRSNLGKRRQTVWPDIKPEQPQSIFNIPPRSVLGRHYLSERNESVNQLGIAVVSGVKTGSAVSLYFLVSRLALRFQRRNNLFVLHIKSRLCWQFPTIFKPIDKELGALMAAMTMTGCLSLAKNTPGHEYNRTPSEMFMKKRLFQFKSPIETTSPSYSSTQDVTGICSLNPSPDFKPSSNSYSPYRGNRTISSFDRLEPPKSPVLKFRHFSNHLSAINLKPPVDPEDVGSWKVFSNRSELAMKDCTSDLNNLELSDGEKKKISPTANKFLGHSYEEINPESNHQHNSKHEVFRFCKENELLLVSLKLEGEETVSPTSTLKESSVQRQDTQIEDLRDLGSNNNHQDEKRIEIGRPFVEPEEVPQGAESLRNSSFNQFKKPEPILQVLRSSEKKLSVVKEDESESAEDSFILAEETISELTIVGDVSAVDARLKSEDSKNIELSDLNGLSDSDDDINELLTHIDRISEKGREQQLLLEKEMSRILDESRKRQIIREKEISQLRQCTYRLKKKNKEKQHFSVENKENYTSESNKKVKNVWIQKIKKNNPNLLKTPNVQRTDRFSVADQSTIWTPRSLSKMVSNQMDDLYD